MLALLRSLFSNEPEEPLDLEIFKNPLAQKISWEPKNSGGKNYKSVRLLTKDSRTLAFVPTTLTYVFSVLLLVGPFIYFILFYVNDTGNFKNAFLEFPLIMIFPAFIGVAMYLGYNTFRPQGFNKQLGYHYKSYKNPASHRDIPDSKNWTKLDDIVALQIIKERVKRKNTSYTSYELNLILKDTTRINVVDHSDQNQIKEDARVIADFVGIPYWDAVNMHLYEPKLPRSHVNLDTDYDSTKRFREM